jgi:uncharacterized membrane protein
MNEAHFHLVVNHLPIIFPLVGIIIMLTGQFAKSEAVKRTAYMIFALGALATIAAMTSGEGAEEIVEKIGGISEDYIKTHEESAEVFALLAYILGGVSLLGLWISFKQKVFSGIFSICVLLFAVIIMYFAKQTGTTGGEIRHTEIRSESSMLAPGDVKSVEDDD